MNHRDAEDEEDLKEEIYRMDRMVRIGKKKDKNGMQRVKRI